MPLTQNSLNTGARWAVTWYSHKKKSFVQKKFGDDFNSALKFYETRQDGWSHITLKCLNIAFPPPTRLTHHEEEKYRVVTRNGKRYKKKYTTTVNRLIELNEQGIWWCSYCIKLRRFERTEDRTRIVMACPVCTVTQYNWFIRQHNPKALNIEYHNTRRTRGSRRLSRRS